MRARTDIAFQDKELPIESVAPKTDHLVVCEETEDGLAEVIAANYAFSLGAGLFSIPKIDESLSKELLEAFYTLYDQQELSQTEALQGLKAELRKACGPLPVPANGSITFITSALPLGFAVPDVPSTHMFSYPDLGRAMINGFAAEQPEHHGIGFVALVDSATADAQEIASLAKILEPRRAFLRTYKGPAANVRDVTEMMYLFPYDLLVIATHCGDTNGLRWTYEYKDFEGIDRTLIVDIGLGFARTDDVDMFAVTQYVRFVSLDGVDWGDREKKKTLYVGTAIEDYLSRTMGGKPELQPVRRETVDRVVGSAALKMYDHNIIVLPKSLADEGTPIVINNACTSWHTLAKTFVFGNSRAYIGTLFPISPAEAQEVVVKMFDRHFAKPLPAALWSAQRDVYGSTVRRPYVATGVYPQRLRVKSHDVISRMISRLSSALDVWRMHLTQVDRKDEQRVKSIEESVKYYERELAHFRDLS